MPNSEEGARVTQLATAAQERSRAGDLQNARTLALEAVPILIKGVADRHLAGASFALSRVLADTREFDKAFQVLNAALDFFLTGGNVALDEFPIFLNRFGNLLREQNRPVEAEPLLVEALKLSKAKASPDQNLIWAIANNLGLVYEQTANLPAAQRAFEDALAACDAAHNEGPDVAITFDNLSSLYMKLDEDSKARPLTERAIEIFAGSGLPNNRDLLTARIRLAQLDARAGDLAEAEKTLNDVLSLAAGDSWDASRNFASASICLAEVLRRSARYVEAEETLQGVLVRLKTAGLGRSGFFINASHQMARVLNAAGNYGGALELLSALVQRDDQETASFARSSSSLRALMYKERLGARFDELLWLVTKHFAGDARAVEQAFLRAANRKQLITERLLRRAHSVLHSSGPLREASAALRALRAQREEAMLKGPGTSNLLVYRRSLANLTAQEEDLEAQIARASDESRNLRRLASVGEVRAMLPHGTALVDIVRFSKFEIERDDGARGAWTGHRYVAFVVEAETEQVKLIDLGDGDAIERDVERHLNELSEWRSGPPAVVPAKDGLGAALSAKIFAPIAAATSAKSLCLSLDGDLAELPFESLPHGGGWVIDEYRVSYVTSSRDLLDDMPAGHSQSPACVVAAVDYDIDDIAPKDRVFRPLWGGAAEGTDIGKLLGVGPLMGNRATKSAVLNVTAPRVLHLATHGVFFDSLMTTPQFTSSRLQAGVVVEDHAVADQYGMQLHTMSRQEWIEMHNEWYGLPRSAVALAGVNSWMLGGEPKGADNGLLMASDVVDMDLDGTDVVVLSACDTARGRAIAADGLLGLRWAFLIAGAHAVIASSWKVSDQATLHLTKAFYGRWIAGESMLEALRGAQLDTRAAYPEPRFWGSFTCLAASRPWPSQLS